MINLQESPSLNKQDSSVNKKQQEELLSTIRGIASLHEDYQKLENKLENAKREDKGIVHNLESERRNVERRLSVARSEVDGVIEEIMAESNAKSFAREQKAREQKQVKVEHLRKNLGSLTGDERLFLTVLASGESNRVARPDGRYSVGLRTADLLKRLIATNHPISHAGNPDKAMRIMLKDLTNREFAFRTGPSLQRIRQEYLEELRYTLAKQDWVFEDITPPSA